VGWLKKLKKVKGIFEERKDVFHRQTRVHLSHKEVYFRPFGFEGDPVLQVINMSLGGMARDKDQVPKKLDKSSPPISGRLYLKDNSMDVTCKIIHRGWKLWRAVNL